MKKVLAILCALIVIFSFAACSPSKCEVCNRETDTKKYSIEGKSAYLCEDCGALVDLAKQFKK